MKVDSGKPLRGGEIGERELGSGEFRGNLLRVGHLRGGSDGGDEEEILSGECAGTDGGVVAAQAVELRKANEGAKRNPVAGDAVGSDGAELDGAEGGRAETRQRVKGGDCGARVLQQEGVVGEAEGGLEAAVGGGDLDFLLAWKRGWDARTQEENDVAAEYEVAGAAQVQGIGGVSGWNGLGFAEQIDLRAWQVDGGRGVEFAAVAQEDTREVIRTGGERGGDPGGCEGELVVVADAVQSGGREGNAGQVEGADFIETVAAQSGGGVTLVQVEVVERGGFGVG